MRRNQHSVHPIHYVRRENNLGRKGGNLNNWLRAYRSAASEFFIALDADMQPLPDMVEAFLGHYHGFSKEVQESIAFIQAPQHFCNHAASHDYYDVGLKLFFKAILTVMDSVGVTMCIGTGTFWRREALLSCGGFHETFATEDTVTGLKVHRANNRVTAGSSKQWISKFLRRPVAVGISPQNLPELFDQRLRWVLGSIETTTEHDWFFFAAGLSLQQKVVYWTATAYWLNALLVFLLQVIGTVSTFIYIGSGSVAWDTVSVWSIVVSMVSGASLYMAILPVATIEEKLVGLQMFLSYAPVYVCCLLKHRFGIPFRVQETAAEGDSRKRCWHWLFWWHILVLAAVCLGATISFYFGDRTVKSFFALTTQVLLWVVYYFPVYLSVFGGIQVDNIVHWYNESDIHL